MNLLFYRREGSLKYWIQFISLEERGRKKVFLAILFVGVLCISKMAIRTATLWCNHCKFRIYMNLSHGLRRSCANCWILSLACELMLTLSPSATRDKPHLNNINCTFYCQFITEYDDSEQHLCILTRLYHCDFHLYLTSIKGLRLIRRCDSWWGSYGA